MPQDHYIYVSTPRQQGKNLFREMFESMESIREQARKDKEEWFVQWQKACPNQVYVGIDRAKSEAARTAGFIMGADGKIRRWDLGAQKPPSAPSAPAAPPPREIAAKAFGEPEFDVDRAWDMVVLAARTSRYGG
jgi:hypothetical protein